MLDDEVFLQAIRANILDDAPWVIYSDWLEDQGRSEKSALYRQPRLVNSIGMQFQLIPPGTFLMGSPKNEKGRDDREEPEHEVTITRPFYLGIYPVTQRQWRAIAGSNPSWFSGTKKKIKGQRTHDLPVESVRWEEVLVYCQLLSELPAEEARWVYRLPTEAEWEYACRAGTRTAYGFGGDANRLGDYAWCGEWNGETHPVGQKRPNAWGLYDMHGNVCEWCQDRYDLYPQTAQVDPKSPAQVNPQTAEDMVRVIRGGSWKDEPGRCRSAARDWSATIYKQPTLGCRLACDTKLPM
jgi:uncharacterized protein (TIGR02996 family)